MDSEPWLVPVRRYRRQLLAGCCLLLAGLGLAAAARPDRAGAQRSAAPATVVAAARQSLHGVVRFHVLAHSDAPADQQVKHLVRAALLPLLQEAASGAATAGELLGRLQDLEPTISAVAAAALAAAGESVPLRVEVGQLPLDGRRLGRLTLPAGDYPAVRVVLGDGGGQNWWCVLFPNLCFEGWVQEVEVDPALVAAAEAALRQAAVGGRLLVLDERDLTELPARPTLALLRWLRALGLSG